MSTLEKGKFLRLKWILVFEAFFAGVYVSLTKGLFVIYLASIGYKIEEISLVVFVSSTVSMVIGWLLYRHPSFILSRVKLKLTGFHALERIIWLLIPLITDSLVVSILYSLYMCFSALVSTFLSFSIYGSFLEEDIKDVTAKRSAANGVSSILGYVLSVFLLVFLPHEGSFIYIFSLGSLVGLISTFLVLFIDLSHLEGLHFPLTITQPERIFSASAFFVILLSSSNLMGIVWAPYVMTQLNGPEYIAASMSLAGTASTIVASLIWSRKSFKALRIGLVLNALGPLIVWATPWPAFHVPINAYTSFTYTAANFIGAFLFAKYNKWFGAVKSSVLLVSLNNASQCVAAALGMLTRGSYLIAFSIVFAVKIMATALALLTVPETAVVPEDVARTYSNLLYNNSLNGYQLAVEISKETVVTTFRLVIISLVIVMLYLIYRVLWLFII
ncbi:MAG: hypothetical protein QXN87_08260 [Candidatus Bathyarchaeia archaeon]